MKQRKYIGFLGLMTVVAMIVSFFPSCREKASISNQIVVTAIGIEEDEKGVSLCVQAVDALKTSASLSEQSQTATGVYRAVGNSISHALQGFLNESGRSTYILHNKLIAIGEKTVQERSIYDVMDFFLRNLESRALVDVVICRKDPQTLLTIQSPNDAIEAEYIAQMLKEGERIGTAVTSRLLTVQQTANGGYDMLAPILTVTDSTPRLDGTAVFQKGRVVGELTQEETTAFLYAADRIDTCLHAQSGITMRVVTSSTRLSFEKDGTVCFEIEGSMEITESEETLTAEGERRCVQSLEREWEQKIKAVLEKLAGEYESDPLALVQRAAHASQTLTLKEASFSVRMKMHLRESRFTT